MATIRIISAEQQDQWRVRLRSVLYAVSVVIFTLVWVSMTIAVSERIYQVIVLLVALPVMLFFRSD